MATLCDACSTSGLPILPVRYAVVPKTLQPALPSWASGDQVTSVELSDEYHYALRTLRKGYIYLLYATHPRGSNHWECYTVSGDGCLRKQPSVWMVLPPTDTFGCSREGHSNVNVHYLVIEQPEKCGATWIAFSEHQWSAETVNEYTRNTQLRNQRMQTLHPSKMIEGAKHSHGHSADATTLGGVLEYHTSFIPVDLPHTGPLATFSKEDGSLLDKSLLTSNSTRYPWSVRKHQADSTLSSMQARAVKKDRSLGTPHVLALWDAIGIAHELNGFRNDVAGWLQQYGHERELQISAQHAIRGLERALVDARGKRVQHELNQENQFRATGYIPARVQSRRDRALKEPASPERTAELRHCELMDYIGNRGVWHAYEYDLARLQDEPSIPKRMASYNAFQARVNRDLAARAADVAATHNEHEQYVRESLWPKYRDRIDNTALINFSKNQDGLLADADRILDQRTQVLIRWLEAPLFLDTLENFHPDCDVDSVQFENAVGDAIFGMGSCTSGALKLKEWITQADATIKSNLIWRAVAFNRQEYATEVNAALQVAFGSQQPLTRERWETAAEQIKWNKVFDVAKKSLTAFNTQAKALFDPTSGIRPVETTRGLDKIFATVGGLWLQPIKWTADSVNEVALRTLLFIRSGADPLAAKALGAWDAVHSAADRDMLIRRLKNQDFWFSAQAKAQYEEHAKKWASLRENVEVPDAKRQNFNAARDARLALIVAVFEAFNLHKISAKAAKDPGNEHVQAHLTAAKYATAGAAIDVLANMVKGIATSGDRAKTYQLLKLGGGSFSAVASGYGAALDFEGVGKSWNIEDYRMVTLLGIRGFFQSVSGALTVLTGLSYCSPIIESFGKRFGQRVAGQMITNTAKWLLAKRAVLVLSSLEVAIFLLAVTVIIWKVEDDELEKWCDRSAFGANRKKVKDPYTSVETQVQRYSEALKAAV